LSKKRRFYKHPSALVDRGAQIGPGTRIWAFAHVMKGARVGRGCNVGDHAFVESGAVVGDEVTIKNGVAVWAQVVLQDRVFVGPHVAFTNDRRPRSRAEWTPEPTLVEHGASIGANATLLCGIRIGRYAMIAGGAVVTKNVAHHTLVAGVPARVLGMVCECGNRVLPQTRRCSRCGLLLKPMKLLRRRFRQGVPLRAFPER